MHVIFLQIKDNNNESGRGRKSFAHYDQIDEILGTRAASQPPVLLQSGGDEGGEHLEDELGGSDVAPQLSPVSSPYTDQFENSEVQGWFEITFFFNIVHNLYRYRT